MGRGRLPASRIKEQVPRQNLAETPTAIEKRGEMRAWARRLVFTHSYSSSFIGDDLSGGVDAGAVKIVDQIDSMIQRDFVEVDGVLEVPTANAAAVLRAGEGDVAFTKTDRTHAPAGRPSIPRLHSKSSRRDAARARHRPCPSHRSVSRDDMLPSSRQSE